MRCAQNQGNTHIRNPRFDNIRGYWKANAQNQGNTHIRNPRLDNIRGYWDANAQNQGNTHISQPANRPASQPASQSRKCPATGLAYETLILLMTLYCKRRF